MASCFRCTPIWTVSYLPAATRHDLEFEYLVSRSRSATRLLSINVDAADMNG